MTEIVGGKNWHSKRSAMTERQMFPVHSTNIDVKFIGPMF
ncbi:hypothetical protein HMPREF3212_01668 [Citrobacter freundii]|nr:hypothetical protein HMPREF3212_01668 [Citrobacter freundii]